MHQWFCKIPIYVNVRGKDPFAFCQEMHSGGHRHRIHLFLPVYIRVPVFHSLIEPALGVCSCSESYAVRHSEKFLIHIRHSIFLQCLRHHISMRAGSHEYVIVAREHICGWISRSDPVLDAERFSLLPGGKRPEHIYIPALREPYSNQTFPYIPVRVFRPVVDIGPGIAQDQCTRTKSSIFLPAILFCSYMSISNSS